MTDIDALPPAMVTRDIIGELEESSSIDGVFPVYSSRNSDLCAGFVIAVGGELMALALIEGSWSVLESREVEESESPGVAFDELEDVEALQNLLVDVLYERRPDY